ncbi:HvfX family Cu-binding RiPP maturation protein [Mannheimia haemolytica]|uniref:HvfX family Cu-binding RiPP maturation protein n=1 Tax=Mannheimia haemolytica TaxID=75985 RepID=UPI00201BCCE4|nr:DoxX family protein [Mannheimia haemolytica]UQX71139.1 DoxX family protein [Mannheimia haemolytica]
MTACKNGLGFLVLRLFLAYEFFEAGLSKLNGENWFASIQESFPFPFNVLPADLSWAIASGVEILLPILLTLGLFTRFSALGLMILTAVAWYAVHAGNGYNVCNNGYKMALIYLVMLVPLLLQGAGSLSLDFLLQKKSPTKRWLKFL